MRGCSILPLYCSKGKLRSNKEHIIPLLSTVRDVSPLFASQVHISDGKSLATVFQKTRKHLTQIAEQHNSPLCPLCLIHCCISIFEKNVRRFSTCGINSNPDTGCDRKEHPH